MGDQDEQRCVEHQWGVAELAVSEAGADVAVRCRACPAIAYVPSDQATRERVPLDLLGGDATT